MSNNTKYPGWQNEAGLYIYSFVYGAGVTPDRANLQVWGCKIMAPNKISAQQRFQHIATAQGMWDSICKFPVNLTTDFIPMMWLDEQIGVIDEEIHLHETEHEPDCPLAEQGTQPKHAPQPTQKDAAPIDVNMVKNILMKKIIDTKDAALLQEHHAEFTSEESAYLHDKITNNAKA